MPPKRKMRSGRPVDELPELPLTPKPPRRVAQMTIGGVPALAHLSPEMQERVVIECEQRGVRLVDVQVLDKRTVMIPNPPKD